MAIEFRCPEMTGTERCEFVAQGVTEDEVFETIWKHFKTAHGLDPATKPIKRVIRYSVSKKSWELQKE